MPNSSPRSNAPARAGQLDHVGGIVDRLERAAAVLALDEARDVPARRSRGAARAGITSMNCSPSQQAREVAVVEHLLGAGRARPRRR